MALIQVSELLSFTQIQLLIYHLDILELVVQYHRDCTNIFTIVKPSRWETQPMYHPYISPLR